MGELMDKKTCLDIVNLIIFLRRPVLSIKLFYKEGLQVIAKILKFFNSIFIQVDFSVPF
jgi:hypothetical protein